MDTTLAAPNAAAPAAGSTTASVDGWLTYAAGGADRSVLLRLRVGPRRPAAPLDVEAALDGVALAPDPDLARRLGDVADWLLRAAEAPATGGADHPAASSSITAPPTTAAPPRETRRYRLVGAMLDDLDRDEDGPRGDRLRVDLALVEWSDGRWFVEAGDDGEGSGEGFWQLRPSDRAGAAFAALIGAAAASDAASRAAPA